MEQTVVTKLSGSKGRNSASGSRLPTRLLTGLVCLLGATAFTLAGRADPFALPTLNQLWKTDGDGVRTSINNAPIPQDMIDARYQSVLDAYGNWTDEMPKDILFGDLHVHTQYSDDAFLFSLPLMHGSAGIRPPAAACNYARYVSQLDFFAVTDHAESYIPRNFHASIDALRMCDEVAKKGRTPDVIPMLGYEWTAIGKLPADHFGHHNVVFEGLGDGQIPTRPIAYDRYIWRGKEAAGWGSVDTENAERYDQFRHFIDLHKETPDCPKNGNTLSFPKDCFEYASTPGALFRKLDELGAESIVIPHGMAWGFSAPLNITWDNELTRENLNNARMPLIEIYSGHGNSEPFRDVMPMTFKVDGTPVCPPATRKYLPSCRQAGEIVRKECLTRGRSKLDCDREAEIARQNYVRVKTSAGWLSVPGATYGKDVEKWLDSGQVRDVFQPAFNYRPYRSAQAALALSKTEDDDQLRFVWGFIGSTDTHHAKAGHGYKQQGRVGTMDLIGGRNDAFQALLYKPNRPDDRLTIPIKTDDKEGLQPFGGIEAERGSSYIYLGGIAAVHTKGRSREQIWAALKRRETYATSGPRILLWFDLIDAAGNAHPMGSEITGRTPPAFRAKAAGSFIQLPGCDPRIVQLVTENGLRELANSECYNPSSKRRGLSRIEVVKITRQAGRDQSIAAAIADPWKTFPCHGRPTCEVKFSDPKFKRDALYYVRAIEVASPAINGEQLRTKFDKRGRPISIQPCYYTTLTPDTDDCLGMSEQRAWSSPIYVNWSRQ